VETVPADEESKDLNEGSRKPTLTKEEFESEDVKAESQNLECASDDVCSEGSSSDIFDEEEELDPAQEEEEESTKRTD
jgi:hypothetical protein